MSEIQNITIVADAEGELRVSSLTIAGRTRGEHRAVLQLIRNNMEDLESFGRVAFEMSPFETAGGVQRREIAHLNEPQATLLTTYMRNTDVVKAFKLALVKEFYRMRQALTTHQLPQSFAEALALAASQAKQMEALEAKRAEDAPKVLFADSVATSSTTILIGELAKILKGNGLDIGANRLFERLREDGYLIKRKGTDWNMPTQRSMDLGLFKIKETAINRTDGVSISKTPKVTGKGQQYFVNRYTEAVGA